MSAVIAFLAAEADPHPVSAKNAEARVGQPAGDIPESQGPHPVAKSATRVGQPTEIFFPENLPAHQFPNWEEAPEEEPEVERARRIYRGRTVAMLRRYMRYSLETGRLPSLLGREFFRAKVTQYTVVTFEDRVIFVHDMEICLERLEEFSRQIIARHILQEHDRWATARLLHCNEKTIRRLTPVVLDQLSDILLEAGLMERIETNAKNSCQGGLEAENSVSDCEDGENKFQKMSTLPSAICYSGIRE